MPTIRETYEEFHESAESLREDRDIHPALRRANWPEPETGKCRACGKRLELNKFTDDLLCADCDAAVEELKEMCK